MLPELGLSGKGNQAVGALGLLAQVVVMQHVVTQLKVVLKREGSELG